MGHAAWASRDVSLPAHTTIRIMLPSANMSSVNRLLRLVYYISIDDSYLSLYLSIGALGIDEKSSQADAEARAVDAQRKFDEERRKKEARRAREKAEFHSEKEKERQRLRDKYQLSNQNKPQAQRETQTSSSDNESRTGSKCTLQ